MVAFEAKCFIRFDWEYNKTNFSISLLQRPLIWWRASQIISLLCSKRSHGPILLRVKTKVSPGELGPAWCDPSRLLPWLTEIYTHRSLASRDLSSSGPSAWPPLLLEYSSSRPKALLLDSLDLCLNATFAAQLFLMTTLLPRLWFSL